MALWTAASQSPLSIGFLRQELYVYSIAVNIFKGDLLFVVIVNYRLYSLCGINTISGSVGSFRGQLIPANV